MKIRPIFKTIDIFSFIQFLSRQTNYIIKFFLLKVLYLVLNTAINRKYLLRYMLSDAFNLQVATAMSSRVKMPKINQDELSKILIPIPPMQEQERIVSKIEELFNKITLI